MISIGLTQTRYVNGRYNDFVKPLSKEMKVELAEVLNMPISIGQDGNV